MRRKSGIGSLLLTGAVAYGIYKLSKMSSQDRNSLLTKGKEILSENLGAFKSKLGSTNGIMHNTPDNTYV